MTSRKTPSISNRIARVVLTLALVAAAAGAGWWAASEALTSADGDVEDVLVEAVWTEAREGSVGRTLPYATTVRQPSNPVAANGLAGVVTEVHPGEVNAGDVLYMVGDTPVRAVLSARPLWRDLARGLQGEDVKTLQGLLTSMGYFDGEAGGIFGPTTEAAVKRWQKAEARPQTGVVQLGELVGFPRLPVTVTLGNDISVGRILVGGEQGVLAPTGEREFVMVLTEDQSRRVPAEATVEVMYEDVTWPAVITGSQPDQHGSMMEFTLAGSDGGEVCGAECDRLPLDAQITLRSQVVVVPHVAGVAVPAAAVKSGPDGSTIVNTAAGPVPVTVKGSGQGVVIVEGIELGTRVQLTAEQRTAIESPADHSTPDPGDPTPSETED